jgi:hypothetical protein
MDIMEIGWEVVDWMHLVQDRNQWRALVNAVIKVGEFFDVVTVSFSRKTLLHGVCSFVRSFVRLSVRPAYIMFWHYHTV